MIELYILYFLLAISILINVNLYIQNNKYIDLNNSNLKYYDLLLRNLLKLFLEVRKRIDSVDKNGSFSSDDEIGFAFKIIEGTINNLVEKLNEINTITESESDVEKIKK